MSYRFEALDGSEQWTTSVGWRLIRQVAVQFGWQPAGTEPPENWDAGRPWNRQYSGNSGQWVTAEDAAGLAIALRAAIASPEFDRLINDFEADYRERLRAESTPTVTLTIRPFSFNDYRQDVEKIVAFCDRGAFSIR